jgi:hypothetical protein
MWWTFYSWRSRTHMGRSKFSSYSCSKLKFIKSNIKYKHYTSQLSVSYCGLSVCGKMKVLLSWQTHTNSHFNVK